MMLQERMRDAGGEEGLASREGSLRQVVEQAPIPVMLHDDSGRVLHLSREWTRLTGYRVEDLPTIGDWISRAYPPERAEAARQAIRAAHREPPGSVFIGGEYRIRTAQGDERVWMFRGASIGPDASGRNVVVSMAVDVTDERAAQAALAQSEERLRLATEAGQVGIFDWDMRGGGLRWDQRLRAIWGLPEGAEVRMETFYAGVHPEDAPHVEDLLRTAQDPRSGGLYDAEFRVVGAVDGKVRYVSARGRATFEDGRPARMTGVCVDVSALREARAVIERDREQLEQQIAERTRQLNEAQNRLAHVQRMEALGQLAGGIAHDFNNVLQAVEAGADLIERRPDPENLPRYLRMLREASARGAAITKRLLTFSRRGELRAEAVQAAQVLSDIEGILRHTFGPEVSLALAIAPGLPPMIADRRQLETVLINLANNARDALEGKGLVTFAAQLETIEAGAGPPRRAPLRAGDYVRIDVKDDGVGMSPELLARAVEPFFTTKPPGQGTGLGLAMARGFAEQSRGNLAIESHPGGGTTVSLWLPVAAEPAAPAQARPAPRGRALPPRLGRILVVDDDALVRQLMTEQLEAAGHEVIPAFDGQSALEIMDEGERIDLIVTDFAMPGMNGVALVREAHEREPDLPAVLLTGYVTDAAESAVSNAIGGRFVLMRKPVDREELLAQISVMLASRER